MYSRNFKVDTDVRLRMLEQQLKAQGDELRDVKAKLAVLEARLESAERAQVTLPNLPGGLTPEEAVQEIYRMCGLGDDK